MKQTKTEMRVAIAKDVIRQIRAKRLTAKVGLYVDMRLRSWPENGADAQKLLTSGEVTECSACALGSAFLSYARLYDEVKVGTKGGLWRDGKTLRADRPVDILRRVFSDAQMDLIESAFERNLSGGSLCPQSGDAISFGGKYGKDESRLLAIMRNIVRNEGTFKP